jgi:hypothetical protein
MTIDLHPYKILIFYDIPELFVAKDSVNTNYLCLKTSENEVPSYVTVPLSERKLNLIQAGLIDLREAFRKSELGFWFMSNFIEKDRLVAEKTDWESVPEDLLPEEGFFFQKIEEEGSLILQESNEKYNTILHLSLTDTPGEESIKVESLADFIKSFQNLIKYTYKKEISQFKKSAREILDEPANYTLRAFASSPGSFKLHLESATRPNLFRENNIERALEKLDLLFIEYSNEDELVAVLKAFKGHSVTSLKRLFEIILRDSLQFDFKWTSQSDLRIRKHTINPIYATKVVELLKTKSDLSQEVKELIGYVHQADVDRGNWRIYNIEDEKEYSGTSEYVKLDGITLETIKYRFICEEYLEEYKISGKEEKKYKLISFDPID